MISWSQNQLAEAANVSRMTVVEFEGERRAPHANNLIAIRTALEAAGVEFLSDDGQQNSGVRLRGSVEWLSTHRGDLPPDDRLVTIQRRHDRLETATFNRETKLWRVAETGEEIPEASVKGWDMADVPLSTVRR